ncbi:TonB-dependent receptor domain-containing protein [Brevundimonas sp.]|uniref:TonB-dependent receptor domain-containing protein n=1 Tax=Brevundimonas sp. TaxID=1871086 RepID=UPI003D6CFFB7
MNSHNSPRAITGVLTVPGVALMGRIALTSPFWISGLLKLADFSSAVGEAAHFGLEPAAPFAVLVILIQIGEALAVILDRFAWLGAGALGVFTLLASLVGHAFWTIEDPVARFHDMNAFTLTQGVIDYLQYDTSDAVQTLKQQVFSAYATGELFDLPAGAVKAVLGAEYRKESNDIGAAPEYDEASDKFDPTLGVTETSLVGEYDVAEVFGELRLPLLANLPGAEELTFEGAVRYSDYSTAGETTAYKLALDWAPIRDIRFRTTYGQAVRAPNISELFTTTRVGGAWLADPCNYYDVDNRISRSQYTKANCQTLAPQNVNTYWQWLDVLNTGNEDLKVETANTFTAGVVLRPRFVPNLSLTVDYFDIDLEDAIDSFGAQLIMEKCVDAPTLNNIFCDYVNRDPVTKNLVSVEVTQLNLAQFTTRGLDFEMDYRFDVHDIGTGAVAGTVAVNAVYTKLLERTFILDPTDPNTIDETVGLFGSPEWKGAIRTSWNSGPWTASWTLRHISPMRPGSHVTSDLYDVSETDHVFYSDLYAGYQLNDRVSVFGGLRNAFDKAPPRLPGAEAGGANFEYGYQAGTYDVLGRTFYVGIRLTR